MIKILRWLLLPFSALYAGIIWIRNRCYDLGWLKSTAFSTPTIVIGNLEVGGTGKTPMTEYLIGLISSTNRRIATLSRGYGRKSRGFRLVETDTDPDESGDEPLQFKQKFPALTVAVDEKRVHGVTLLQDGHDLILLDDAFQHRALRPGFSILLFDFNRIHQLPLTLPTGDYRDNFAERKRANVLVVTKCPSRLDSTQRQRISKKLKSANRPSQAILFAYTDYGALVPLFPSEVSHGTFGKDLFVKEMRDSVAVFLVTGIARPEPLLRFVQPRVGKVEHLSYPDHYRFSIKDVEQLVRRFEDFRAASLAQGKTPMLLTTEKDAMRLRAPEFGALLQHVPAYYLPIRLQFHDGDQQIFDQAILEYLNS